MTKLATIEILTDDPLYGDNRLIGRFDATDMTRQQAVEAARALIEAPIRSDPTDALGKPTRRRQVHSHELSESRYVDGRNLSFEGARFDLTEHGPYGSQRRLKALLVLEELTPLREAAGALAAS